MRKAEELGRRLRVALDAEKPCNVESLPLEKTPIPQSGPDQPAPAARVGVLGDLLKS